MLTTIMQKYLGDRMQWYGSRTIPSEQVLLPMIRDISESPAAHADEFYAGLVISDSYFLLGWLEEALAACPAPTIGQQWALLSNKRLNLLYANGKDIGATEALGLFPKRLTKYGLENVERVAVIVGERISELSRGGSILESTVRVEGTTLQTPFIAYNGTLHSKEVSLSAAYYDFTRSSSLRETIGNLSRLAENLLREESGVPNVGEGWVAETRLFRELQRAFPQLRVEQHASPDWLGRQHLDIYFPDIRVGVEFQGSQHEQPIAYFGGQAAFEVQKNRDKSKQAKCKRNGIRLVYAQAGYDLSSLVSQVDDMLEALRRALP
jgi:hypothetical protein